MYVHVHTAPSSGQPGAKAQNIDFTTPPPSPAHTHKKRMVPPTTKSGSQKARSLPTPWSNGLNTGPKLELLTHAWWERNALIRVCGNERNEMMCPTFSIGRGGNQTDHRLLDTAHKAYPTTQQDIPNIASFQNSLDKKQFIKHSLPYLGSLVMPNFTFQETLA